MLALPSFSVKFKEFHIQSPKIEIWGYTGLYRTILGNKGTYWAIQNLIGLYRTLWDHIWNNTGPNWTIQEQSGPYGTNPDHMWQYGTIRDHKRPYWIILNHTGPSRTELDRTRPYMTIRNHMRQYETVQRQYETVWVRTGPYGTRFSLYVYMAWMTITRYVSVPNVLKW